MLVCVFVIALISLMVMGILNALSVQSATTFINQQTDHAAYAAEAGIEHARSRLENRPSWTGRLRWSDRNSKVSAGRDRRRYDVRVTRDRTGQMVITSTGYFNKVSQQRTAIVPAGG